jgi:hypothetical protein
MTTSEIARSLGRRGGQARSARMSAAEKRRIAAIGAAARVRSLRMARHVEANFGYVTAIRSLSGRHTRVERLRVCHDRLPGLYRHGS